MPRRHEHASQGGAGDVALLAPPPHVHGIAWVAGAAERIGQLLKAAELGDHALRG